MTTFTYRWTAIDSAADGTFRVDGSFHINNSLKLTSQGVISLAQRSRHGTQGPLRDGIVLQLSSLVMRRRSDCTGRCTADPSDCHPQLQQPIPFRSIGSAPTSWPDLQSDARGSVERLGCSAQRRAWRRRLGCPNPRRNWPTRLGCSGPRHGTPAGPRSSTSPARTTVTKRPSTKPRERPGSRAAALPALRFSHGRGPSSFRTVRVSVAGVTPRRRAPVPREPRSSRRPGAPEVNVASRGWPSCAALRWWRLNRTTTNSKTSRHTQAQRPSRPSRGRSRFGAASLPTDKPSESPQQLRRELGRCHCMLTYADSNCGGPPGPTTTSLPRSVTLSAEPLPSRPAAPGICHRPFSRLLRHRCQARSV